MNGYEDELGWSAAWLLRATNDSHYKTEFEKHWKDFNLGDLKDKAYANELGKTRL
jgi:hypothetical protein